ncbi:MAG: hypothetical protein Q9164_000200 [Protoblastenia rupestris]
MAEASGVPFHSAQEPPRAPCPLCSAEKGDSAPKKLFFINGIVPGEYDKEIPETYFQTPPVELVSGEAGSEALRFQYLALVRFGTKTYEKMCQSASKLEYWEDRKPHIIRSLGRVAPLKDELISAARKLMTLRQDTSSIEATLKLVNVNLSSLVLRQTDTHDKSPLYQVAISSNGDRQTTSYDHSTDLSQSASASAADLKALRKGIPSSGAVKRSTATTTGFFPSSNGHKLAKREPTGSRINASKRGQHFVNGFRRDQPLRRDQMPPIHPRPQPLPRIGQTFLDHHCDDNERTIQGQARGCNKENRCSDHMNQSCEIQRVQHEPSKLPRHRSPHFTMNELTFNHRTDPNLNRLRNDHRMPVSDDGELQTNSNHRPTPTRSYKVLVDGAADGGARSYSFSSHMRSSINHNYQPSRTPANNTTQTAVPIKSPHFSGFSNHVNGHTRARSTPRDNAFWMDQTWRDRKSDGRGYR